MVGWSPSDELLVSSPEEPARSTELLYVIESCKNKKTTGFSTNQECVAYKFVFVAFFQLLLLK